MTLSSFLHPWRPSPGTNIQKSWQKKAGGWPWLSQSLPALGAGSPRTCGYCHALSGCPRRPPKFLFGGKDGIGHKTECNHAREQPQPDDSTRFWATPPPLKYNEIGEKTTEKKTKNKTQIQNLKSKVIGMQRDAVTRLMYCQVFSVSFPPKI